MGDQTNDLPADGSDQTPPAQYPGMDADQLQYEDTLVDRGVDDVLDEGYSPPDHLVNAETFFETPEEAAEGESLDDKLSAELPDPANELPDPLADDPDEVDQADESSVGEERAGRLVAPDEGLGVDAESESVAEDVGIDGSAASAEEAAVHVLPEE